MKFSKCIGLSIATILAAIVAVSTSPTPQNAVAQSAGDIINLFGGAMQSAIVQATQSEWRKLSENEIACVDQTLHQRGSSLQTLMKQGITPSDARAAEVRSTCRSQIAPQPSQAMGTDAHASKFAVDGLALGGRVQFDSAAYREYECAPSDQFAGSTWCHRKRVEKEARGQFASSYSILHSADGTALYVSRSLVPAFFTGNEANEEIDRLSRKHGAPPRIIAMPQRTGLPQGMIASWGNVVLEPLDTSSATQIAAGRNVQRGFLIDHIGDFQRSAQLGLPIYRLSGGAGYVYAASYDQSGSGTLRFLTIDASAISPSIQTAQQPNPTPILDAQPSQAPNAAPQSRKQGEFARLTEIPSSCQAARNPDPQLPARDPFTGRGGPTPACAAILDCRKALVVQTTSIINYLKLNPSVMDALRGLRLTSGIRMYPQQDGLFRELAEELRSFGENIHGSSCTYERMIIDEHWLNLKPNSERKRSFEVFVTAGQTLLDKLRSDFKAEESEYRALNAFNDRYVGSERFDRAQAEYRQAFDEDDAPRMIQAGSAIRADLEQSRARKQFLTQQSLQITRYQEALSDLSAAFDREALSRFASAQGPVMFTGLRTDLERLGEEAPGNRGDIAPQLKIFETRLHDVEDAVRVARSDKAQAEQSRLLIAQRESAARQLINAASREELKGALDEQFVQSANEVTNRLTALRSIELWLIREKRGEIQVAMQQLDSLEQRVAAAQAKYDRAKALDERRRSALANIATALADFSPADIRGRISNESGTLLAGLNAQRDELSRLDAVRMVERPDYTAALTTSEDTVTKLQQLRAEIAQVDQLMADFKKLQERISARGQNLLDNPSSAQFKELSDSITSLIREKLSLTTEARKRFVQSQTILLRLDSTVDAVMNQEEKRQELARRVAALSPEARTFVGRHPEYQADKDPTDAQQMFIVLYAADVALEFCTEQAWFSEYRKPLAEVRRREILIEAVLGLQGLPVPKIAELKAAIATGKDQLRYTAKWGQGGPSKTCDDFVVQLSLSQPW